MVHLTPDAAEVALERGVEEIHLRRLVAVREPGVEAEEYPRVEVEGSLHGRRRRRCSRGTRVGFLLASVSAPPRFGDGGLWR